MRKSQYLAVATAALGVVGVGGFGAAISIAAPTATIAKAAPALKLAKVAVKSGSSAVKTTVLVNAQGRAVYLLTGDKTTHAECATKACLGAWPAVVSGAGKPTLGAGIKGKLTVWHHAGVRQLVLAGHPLYTFVGDKTSGVANGEGLASDGGVWKVLSGSGAAAMIAGAPSGTGTTAAGSATGTSGSGSTGSGSAGSGSGSGASGSGSTQAGGSSGSAAGSSGSGSSASGSGSSGSGSGSGSSGASGSGANGSPAAPSSNTPSTSTPSTTTPSTTTPSTTTPSTTTPSTTTPSTTTPQATTPSTPSQPVDEWS